MQQIDWMKSGAICLFVGLLTVSGLHGLAGDILLFKSDALSLLTYLCATGTFCGTILALLFSPLFFVLKRRSLLVLSQITLFGLVGMSFFLLVFFLSMQMQEAGNYLLTDLLKNIYFLILLLLVTIGAAVTAAIRLAGCEDCQKRLHLLATVVAPVMLLIGVGNPVLNSILTSTNKSATGVENKNLVLIVLDGFNAADLNMYQSTVKPTDWDKALGAGKAFARFYSSAIWTNGYFTTLHQGSPRAIYNFIPRRAKKETVLYPEKRTNLLKKVEHLGVASRWITFHGNGIPDSVAGKVSDYGGLRSSFLTHNYAWLPRLLQLDYHLLIASRLFLLLPEKTMLKGPLGKKLFRLLNPIQEVKNVYTDILLPEYKSLSARNRKSLTIFHITSGMASLGAENEVGDNVVYSTEGRAPAAFDQFMQEIGSLPERPAIFLTSDHGYSKQPGKKGKTIYDHEEVARVPFLYFGPAVPSMESDVHRVFNTVDLHYFISDFFDEEQIFTFRGAAERDSFRIYQTMPGDLGWRAIDQRQISWYLVFIRGESKYVINLHPKGNADVTEYRIDEVTQKKVREWQGELPPAIGLDLFRKTLDEKGFLVDEIHSNFQALLDQ